MNVVYFPVHTILAAVILLIVPVVFHLVAFRKSTRFIHVLTSILVGTFILTVMGEVAGLTHLFDDRIILTLSILIAGISGRWINKSGIFGKEDILGNNVSKTSILLVAGISIFFYYQKNIFPPFSFDTLNTYLPWARIVVNEHSIPPFHFDSNPSYVISYPTLLYTSIALWREGTGRRSVGTGTHIFRTQMRVKDGNKTGLITYLINDREVSSEEPDEGKLQVRFEGVHSNLGANTPVGGAL